MNELRKILNGKKMSVYQLAKKAKIGQSTAHELVHGNREPKISTARKISHALDIPIQEIFCKEE
ncbi:transcriptional regulator [Clostridium botulinum]